MTNRAKYVRRAGATVTAVQLDLDTDGFSYRKWGGIQKCKPGDWIVNNAGEVYTVDRESFARGYRAVAPGVYRKVAPVWAERADRDGEIRTKEGVTRYQAGAYVVFNDEQGLDGYAMEPKAFEEMYEPAEG
jgi:hypothetical protein